MTTDRAAWAEAVTAFTAPDQPRWSALELMAAAAEAVDVARTYAEAMDRMAEILATGPDEVAALAAKAKALTAPTLCDTLGVHDPDRATGICRTCQRPGPWTRDQLCGHHDATPAVIRPAEPA